jgi:hypothetical protein
LNHAANQVLQTATALGSVHERVEHRQRQSDRKARSCLRIMGLSLKMTIPTGERFVDAVARENAGLASESRLQSPSASKLKPSNPLTLPPTARYGGRHVG